MSFFEFDQHYLLSSGLIIILLQVLFFIPASFFKTDKLTDLSYGLTFIILSASFLYFIPRMSITLQIAHILVILWGVRLTTYLFIRILKIKKDYRFDERRNNLLNLAFFWGLQSFTIWMAMLPLTLAANNEIGLGWSFGETLGLLLWFSGFVIESIADQQKFSFKNDSRNKNNFIQTGLWRFSRHPNYFGESLLWWGIFIMLVPTLKNMAFLGVLSPVFITFLLLKVSGIPLLQKAADQKYGKDAKYQKYKKHTNLFLPWFPKNK